MKVLDTWTPGEAGGLDRLRSSHYFTSRGDGHHRQRLLRPGRALPRRLATRRDIRQVGYYRQDDSTWAAYWHKGHVFVADFGRGVDILKFDGTTKSRTVAAPPLTANRAPKLTFSRAAFGGLCPLTLPRGA